MIAHVGVIGGAVHFLKSKSIGDLCGWRKALIFSCMIP